MKKLITLKNIFITIVIIYIILNLLYILNFGVFSLSKSHDIWAQYGDFIGGSLNPIFTIALIYLTYTISESNDKRIKESIELQKKITLTQLRQEALTNLTKTLNDVDIKKHEPHSYKLWAMKNLELETFRNQNNYLFKDILTETFIINTYTPLLNINFQLIYFQEKNPNIDDQTLLTTFAQAKSNLISELNKFIIDDIDII